MLLSISTRTLVAAGVLVVAAAATLLVTRPVAAGPDPVPAPNAEIEELKKSLREERQKRVELAEIVSGLSAEHAKFKKEQEKNNEKFATVDRLLPFDGNERIHWQTPAKNPEFRELIDGGVAGTGPGGARQLLRWVPFPSGKTFATAPRVSIGLTSLDVFAGQTRVNAQVSKVTKEGFEIRILTWGNTGIFEADVSYTVFPQ